MFRIILVSSMLVLGACASHYGEPISANMSVNQKATWGSKTVSGNLAKAIENTYWRLPHKAASKHSQSVYFAINNLADGEKMQWVDNESGTDGSIVILMTNQYGGSYCRLVNSYVNYGHKTRSLNEFACTNNGGTDWTFRPTNG